MSHVTMQSVAQNFTKWQLKLGIDLCKTAEDSLIVQSTDGFP